MRFIKKTKFQKNGKIIKKYKLFGLSVLRKEILPFKKKWNVLGIKFCKKHKIKNINFINVRETSFYKEDKLEEIKNYLSKSKYIILWIDHSLGGGTEIYSYNCFNSSAQETNYLRLQYFHYNKSFVINLPKDVNNIKLSFETIEDVFNFLSSFNFNEIVVNNLVGFPSTINVLKFITNLKEKKPQVKVSFRGHDYQCICPSFNLLDYNNKYCNLSYENNCDHCLNHKILGKNEYEDKILKSGATSIKEWRKAWKHFFENSLDEFVVFSKNVGNIFCKVYPILEDKMVVIPHNVSKFSKVNIEQHEDINIGILGNISLLQKGSKVIEEMDILLDNYSNVNLIIIGNYTNNYKNLKILGEYEAKQLPLIMQKEKIDIVFIPSIWPETFSYTTQEAMNMGIPVACFNLGAPAERVKMYDKGLIISNISASEALDNLVHYIKNIRKEK